MGCDSITAMSTPAASPSLPADLAAAHAMILAERAKRIEAEAAASSVEAVITHLKLTIERLRRELYGQRSERTARLIDQMELQLEELEARATEDEIAAQESARGVTAGARTTPEIHAQALPREPAAGARRRAGADQLPLLRLGEAVEARRGRHRDPGDRAAILEGDPDGTREVHLPLLRGYHAAAGALPRDAARLREADPWRRPSSNCSRTSSANSACPTSSSAMT